MSIYEYVYLSESWFVEVSLGAVRIQAELYPFPIYFAGIFDILVDASKTLQRCGYFGILKHTLLFT